MNGMDDNGQTHSTTKSDEGRWPLIEQAMEMFFSGSAQSITAAIETIEGLARSTYYSYQEKFPAEFLLLEQHVQGRALQQRRSVEIAFANEQLAISNEVQRTASAAIRELLPMWKSIALGEVREVVYENKAGVEVKKFIVPYPRDQMKAAQALLSVARDGTRPEFGLDHIGIAPPAVPKEEEQKQIVVPAEMKYDLIPGLVKNDFQNVTATRADGTVVHVSVSGPAEIVDIEPEQQP